MIFVIATQYQYYQNNVWEDVTKGFRSVIIFYDCGKNNLKMNSNLYIFTFLFS